MKLSVIDGNSLINRAFYGVRLLSNSRGLYTNGVYGFLSILFKILDEDKPDALCVTFDLKAPTFRHQRYEGYKASRTGMPEELAAQMPVLKQVLDAMNIPRYELEGYEADDLIGTISRITSESGWDCEVVTGDRDSFQLIGEHVVVKLISTAMGRTETKTVDLAALREQYGLAPAQMIDLKALMGDKSDEIPGVAGIGEKTALMLMQKFGSLETLFRDYEESDLKEGVKKKLREGRELADLSRELAEIDRHVPLEFTPDSALRVPPKEEELYNLFVELEFQRFIDRMGLKPGEAGGPVRAQGMELPPVRAVQTEQDAGALLQRCREEAQVGVLFPLDLETVAVALERETAVVRAAGFEGDYAAFLKELCAPGIRKITHDLKSLLTKLLREEIPCGDFVGDTILLAYLLDPSQNSYGLERLSLSRLGHELPEGKTTFQAKDAFAPLQDGQAALEALGDHAGAVRALYPGLLGEVEDLGMGELYRRVELPLCGVLADMEVRGFRVDRRQLLEFGQALGDRMVQLEQEVYNLVGKEFNLNSSRQLGVILFEELKLPPVKKTKTGYSTDIEVLEKLYEEHPVIPKLIEYRQISKLKSTYTDGLLKVLGEDGKLHTTFQMTVTATGRLSSTEPNLQNIPVRQELGGELRRMFVPCVPGWKLVDADYSQIELRVLAHIADDPVMLEAFRTGEDIHTITAAQVFHVDPSEVTPLQRRHAKAVNFGIVYGISDFSLSQDIGVSRAEGRQYMDRYFEKYSGVRSYMDSIVEQAREQGYVTTLMGRRRYLPELKSKNFNIRSFGERVALNTPIQGTAADIIKAAMVGVHRALKEGGFQARLILQVHDELIVEAPEAEVEQVKRLLEDVMEHVEKLRVELRAEAGVGDTWYDAKQ